MAKRDNRANSAQTETKKRVNNRRAAAAKETAVEAVEVEAVEVESVPAALPVAANTDNGKGKVTNKDVLKAAGSIRAAIKEERRGANCTIRLIAERAAAGDAAAVDILCALCDVPRAALYSLNIDMVRAAVNAYYPYYTLVIERDKESLQIISQRKVSVKPVGVWYSTAANGEAIEDAAKRVQRGYRVTAVSDYLDQLIKAAKSRAKGVTPRRVDADAVYNNIELSDAAVGVTAKEIDDAKARRAYSPNGVNVWMKDRNGFYI